MKDNKLSLTDQKVDVEELQKKIAELINENKSLKKQKKFGLVWEDKPDAQVLRVRDEAPMLREDPSKAVVGDTSDTNHILINGDNFHALTALRATHMGKVDVIYIDPPYNTGNKDFIYNDDFVDTEDGFRHSKWLSFMEKRITASKELLTESGVIIVAIGNDELHTLRLLMNDILGDSNFISQITWAGDIKNDSHFVSNTSDYMLIYAKDKNYLTKMNIRFRTKKSGVDEMLNAAQEIWMQVKNSNEATKLFKEWFKKQPDDGPVKSQKGNWSYQTIDEDGNIFTAADAAAPDKPETRSHIAITNPKTGLEHPAPSTGWRWSEETLATHVRNNRIVFNGAGSIPRYKRFLYEVDEMVLKDTFYAARSDSNRYLANILGKNKFPFPKDHRIISQWINYVSGNNRNAIVLDFFAGSGTTAHAVAELNQQDGGSRQCILVTDGGKTETTGESSKNARETAVNIAEEITYERVRRVLTGKDWADGKEHEPLGGNLRYFKVEMEPIASGLTELDQRFSLENYAVEHAKIAANLFNEISSKNEFDEETCMLVDYKVFADEVNDRYLLGVNAHDYSLSDLEGWFKGLPETANVTMIGSGLEEIDWVRKNSDRITVDDVLGSVIRSRKYVASKLPLI